MSRFRLSLSLKLITVSCMITVAIPAFSASSRVLVNEANKLMYSPDSAKRADALEKYLQARDKRKDRFEIPFDIGTAYENLGRNNEAMSWLEEAARSTDKKVKSDAYYQMGNVLFRDKKYDDAIKSYTEALRAAPSDSNARKNLELALYMKRVQPPDSNKQDKDNQDQKNKQQNPDSTKQQQQQKPKHDKMLDQARERETDLQKQLMKKRNQGEPGNPSSGKDW